MLYCTYTLQADNLSNAIQSSNIKLVRLLLEEKKLTTQEYEQYIDIAEKTILIRKSCYAKSLTGWSSSTYLSLSYVSFLIGIFDLVSNKNEICHIQPRHIAACVSLFSLARGIKLIVDDADAYYFNSLAIKKALHNAKPINQSLL